MTQKQRIETAKAIYLTWDKALAEYDMDGLISLYAEHAIIESPLICHLLNKSEGVCQGKTELRCLLDTITERRPPIRKFFKQNFFTDGKTLMFEYPRATPDGEQIDFIEVMEIQDGLIHYHRIYWGWKGFKVLENDAYRR